MKRFRRIHEGDEFTIDEELRGELEFDVPSPNEEPPVEIQGEPWGWNKPGNKPRGWPGPDHSRDDPGPFDGEWERPE